MKILNLKNRYLRIKPGPQAGFKVKLKKETYLKIFC